jgi:alkaline phosphatase
MTKYRPILPPAFRPWTVLLFPLLVGALTGSNCGDTEEVVPNVAPVAKAGTDQSVDEGAMVTLNGSASSDPDGQIASYLWTQVRGTSVALSSPIAANPTFTAPQVGLGGETLCFTLTITDSSGGVHIDSVDVKVKNVGKAKYVILMIGDGMQLAHEVATSRYLHDGDTDLSWHSLPYQTVCTTWDVTCYDRYAWAGGYAKYTASTWVPVVGYDPFWGGDWTYNGSTWSPPSDAYFTTSLALWGGGSAAPPATDSASAGTALACGVKTDDGNVCWLTGDPAGGSLSMVTEKARTQKTQAYGIVSTVQFCHATPACFASHNVDRNDYPALGHEIAFTTRPDVVIGAGHPKYQAISSRKKNTAYKLNMFAKSTAGDFYECTTAGTTGSGEPTWNTTVGGTTTDGTVTWTRRANDMNYHYLPKTDYDGLKAGAATPYSEYVFIERQDATNGTTTLNTAVTHILDSGHANYNKKLFGLFGGSGGYFEHPVPSDTPGAPGFSWTGNPELNPSLAVCSTAALKILNLRGGSNGFFVMIEGGDIDWANHASDYSWMIGATYQFDEAVKAVINYVNDPTTPQTWDNTLLIVTADHGNSFMRINSVLGDGDLPQQNIGAGAYPFDYPGGEITYVLNNAHTNEPVMVYAKGAGAELFPSYEGTWYPGTRLIDNTQIFNVMMEALGLE